MSGVTEILLRNRFTDISHKLEILHFGLWFRVMHTYKFSVFGSSLHL